MSIPDPPHCTPESVARAREDAQRQRIANDCCPTCGLSNRLHRGAAGTWLGCDVATYVRRVSDRPANPERWNDPYTGITLALRAAMVDGSCGPRFEIEMSGYTSDDQLSIASALARVAVSEYIALIGRGEARRFNYYRLPDGRTVPVDATAAKEARMITFTLDDGTIVDAVRVEGVR